MNTFSITEAIKTGWQKTFQNVGLWLGIMLTAGITNIVLTNITSNSEGILSLILTIASIVIQTIIEIGIIGIALRLLDGHPVKYTDIFQGYPLTGQFLMALVVGSVIVAAGLIVFIIPGIYIGLRLSQSFYLVVDQKLSGIDALKRSWAITQGHALQLLLLAIVVGLINMVGAIALLIGLLVTIPTTTIAMAFVYRKLSTGAFPLQTVPAAAVATPLPPTLS